MTTDDVEEMTGTPPRTFASFAADGADAARCTGVTITRRCRDE
jgi:hypothetical protein